MPPTPRRIAVDEPLARAIEAIEGGSLGASGGVRVVSKPEAPIRDAKVM